MAARAFRRARLGAARASVRVTVDTRTETYEQAIAAVRAAYGRNAAVQASEATDETL